MRRIRPFFFRLAALFDRDLGECEMGGEEGQHSAIAQLLKEAGGAEW